MNCTQLNEVLNEYEVIIKELSEVLIRELALRDELEYDKELKNQFISLLLTIQKRRRDGNLDKKKKKNKSVNNNMNSPETTSTVSQTVIKNSHLKLDLWFNSFLSPCKPKRKKVCVNLSIKHECWLYFKQVAFLLFIPTLWAGAKHFWKGTKHSCENWSNKNNNPFLVILFWIKFDCCFCN